MWKCWLPTSNWTQVWKASFDVCVNKVVFFSRDIKVTVMTRVPLGCRRVAQNLASAPASITAGMATRYWLHTASHIQQLLQWTTHTDKNTLKTNSRFSHRLIHMHPAQEDTQSAAQDPETVHDWLWSFSVSASAKYRLIVPTHIHCNSHVFETHSCTLISTKSITYTFTKSQSCFQHWTLNYRQQ